MEIRKLPAIDRPREIYQYEVHGFGMFPMDMLRYDTCWPADSEAVSRMITSRGHAEERRTVALRSYSRPTLDRWTSFGWIVLDPGTMTC